METQFVFLDERWNDVIDRLPRDLDESARAYGAVERLRNIPSAANLVRMILAYAVSDLSLKDTAAWAKAGGIASLTGQAFHYRLQNSEAWLQELLVQVLFGGQTGDSTERPLRVVDGTVITGPGSKGTDWVLHVLVDPVSGKFKSVDITDCRGAETFKRYSVEPGEIVLGDRIYGTAKGIEFVVNRQAHPLVRVTPHRLKICDLDRQKIRLESYEATVVEKGIVSLDVLIPTPPEMAGKKRKAWKLADARSWIPARLVGGRTKKGVIWVLTTLTAEELSDHAVLKLYRLRWQIELLFKRLKSLLHLDDLPTRDGPTSKAWLLGRLLAAAVAQALVTPTGLFPPADGDRQRRVDFQSQCLVKMPGSPVGAQSSDLR